MSVVALPVVVPHEAPSVTRVRHALLDDLSGRVPAVVADDAALVVSELVANAVRHGSPLPGGTVRVSWELADDLLRLRVADGGPGPRVAVRPVEFSAEGGRGLAIVQLLSRDWGTAALPGGGVEVHADLPLVPSDGSSGDGGTEHRPSYA